MKATILVSAFAFACTGSDPGGHEQLAPPTDIQWPEDDSLSDWFHADGVQIAFFLSTRPRPGTIDVLVRDNADGGVVHYFIELGGDPPDGDYVYDAPSNSVRFLRYVPPPESDVIARYSPVNPPPSR